MTSQRCQPGRRSITLVAIGLVLWTVTLRLPLIANPLDVSPDGCEYIGIARHLAEEGRWVSAIKWHFFTAEPVVHAALADRPPLFPLWAALWIGHGSRAQQVYRVRLANVFLSAAVVAAAFVLLIGLFPFPVAAGAALLFATYPAFVRDSAQPLTEPLFLLLLLSAFQAFLVPQPHLFAVGVLTGLAYLTRPAAVLLLPVFGVETILRGWKDIANCKLQIAICNVFRLRSLFLLFTGFCLVCLPYWLAVWRLYGNPFYSVLSYNFSIGHIYEGTFYGFERHFPSPLEFVRQNPARVARLIWAQGTNLGATLLRSLRYLWPLALLLRWEDLRRHRLLLAFTALNFAFHAVSWVVWGAARYQFPGYLFLAAVLIEAPLRRFGSPRARWLGLVVATVAVVAALAACVAGTARLFREKRSPAAGSRLGWAAREAAEWLASHPLAGTGVCASNDPAMLNLLTGCPAIVLPRFRDAGQARRFLGRYRPGALVLAVDDRADMAVADVLMQEPWSAARVRPELAPWLHPVLVRTHPRRRGAGGLRKEPQAPDQWLLILRTGWGIIR